MSKLDVTLEGMMEAGMHFGHQTHRRNPKMNKYIFDIKSGVHIIDLTKTEGLLKAALDFAGSMSKDGKQIIFVGSKRQASELIKRYATACDMPFVSERWLGGIMTNYETIKKRLKYLKELDERFATDNFVGITKKERVLLDQDLKKLDLVLGGLRNLKGLPGALFVVDIIKDHIAVQEAKKLGIPVIAIVDTNVNPDLVDFPIPANDDARKSIEYILERVANACKVGGTVKVEPKAEPVLAAAVKEEGEE